MTFSNKLLACVLGVCLAEAAALVCLFDYRRSAQTQRAQFWQHYTTLGASLGATYTQVESATDSVLVNALRAFATIESRDGMPSEGGLDALAKSLHVTSMGAHGADGVSIIFSNHRMRRARSHFSTCAPIIAS